MTDVHDLIVLGAGSGGLGVTLRAAQHGARVALLDPDPVGGTCVHRGCLPKKALWFAAQWAHAQELAAQVGFASRPGPLDWARYCAVRQRYIDAVEQHYAQKLQALEVQRVHQAARFVTSDTVELTDGRHLRATHVVIATGARPRRLDLPGFDLGMVSDDVFALHERPGRVAIVGGGYIAVEFAGMLRALGSEVDVLARERLLEGFDAELTAALSQQMREQGIGVCLQTCTGAARRRDDDGRILLDDVHAGVRGPYDALLWAVGRVPNTETLGLEAIGVQLDEHRHVLTDRWQDTSVKGVHAIGDVTARKALTPVAVAAGRRLADRLFGDQPQARLDYDNVPSVVFSKPPLGMVGLTEAQAREQHGDAVSVHCQRFTPMQWALAGRREQSLFKLVCVGPRERVVGIHALGPGVDEMLQGFAVALKLGLHRRDLAATVAIHPSSAEELVLMG
jgi:glutathione reductase (NADPH)